MIPKYVLVTAARNEEHYIEKTISSVVAQSVKPEKWIIVNDGSTDRTEEILNFYSLKYSFIHPLNIKSDKNRNFASKIYAIHEGMKSLKGTDYDFIGNIDSDIEFGTDYFEILMTRFREDEKLGIAGGWIHELQKGKYKERFGNAEYSVPGAIQTFRRECFESIGRFLPLKTGGEDSIAEVMARMHGWLTISFRDLKVFHLRMTGTEKTGILGARYRQGKQDYFLGNHPLFELLKFCSRIQAKPPIIGSVFSLIGYLSGILSKEHIAVPRDVKDYLRKEQMDRIISLIKSK